MGKRETSPVNETPGRRGGPSRTAAFLFPSFLRKRESTARCGGLPRTALFVLAVLLLLPVALLACTGESSTLGQYRQGRTLHFSVVSIERTPELRYSTIDPQGVVRRWSIAASSEGMELAVVRARVENHTAVSAFINVDRNAAELRDFTNATYFPLSVTESVWQDFRGESEALVRMDLGQCFDGTRALVHPGATVRWQSEAGETQFIAFDDPSVAFGPTGQAEIEPGSSVSHTFSQAGTYSYNCGTSESADWPAEIQVAVPQAGTDYIDRSTLFIQGSFELLQGHGLDGYMIFEVPAGTEFRDMRWRAGDSITFRF